MENDIFSVSGIGHITNLLYICTVNKHIDGMKWNELRKIAETNGWYLWRHGANHDIYRHPDKSYPIQIGRHGTEEIKNGTFNKLKKQIGF